MNKIIKAVTTITLFSIITRTLGFFFRIFLSRQLGAEGLGLFQMASSILGIFLTIVSSGLPLTTAKLVSKYTSNNEIKKRDQVVTSATIIALCVSIICSLLLLVLKRFWGIIIPDNRAVELLIILIPSICFSALYAVLRGALWGQNDYFNCGLTELIEQILRFVITALLMINVSDILTATKHSAIAFNITCLLSGILTLVLYLMRSKFCIGKGEYKNILKSAMPITGVRLANSFVQPLATIIIPFMLIVGGYTQSEATSSFGVIMGMTFPMLYVPMTIVGSISMVLIPTISSLLAKKDYVTIEQNINKSINVSMFISFIFVTLYLSVGNLIGEILYNNQMSGALLQLSAGCVLPITLCNLTGSILNALNLEVKSFKNYLIGSSLLLLILLTLTPFIGISSVIIAEFTSMTTITILNLKRIKSKIPNIQTNLFTTTYKYVITILPSGLTGYFVSKICLNILPKFFSCIIGGGIAIVFMLVLCEMFNIYSLKETYKLIKHKQAQQIE